MCPSTCDVVDAKVQLLLCNEVFYAPQSYMITISFCVSSSIARPGSNMARFSIASNAFWGIDILFKAEQPLNGLSRRPSHPVHYTVSQITCITGKQVILYILSG